MDQLAGHRAALDALARTRDRVLAEQLTLCGTCTGQRVIVNPNNDRVETCPACRGAGVR